MAMETKKLFLNEMKDNWIDKTWWTMLIYTFMNLISFELQNAELKQFERKMTLKINKTVQIWTEVLLLFE